MIGFPPPDISPETYTTPREAEDEFYAALEEGDLNRLVSVRADTDAICYLSPVAPFSQGRKGIEDLFSHLFSQGQGVELSATSGIWSMRSTV